MNSGSFFRLYLENSKVVEGVTYFEYIDLPDLDAGQDGLRYPIKMAITQDRVLFLVHYFQDESWPPHTEEVILDLPFSVSNTEALSSIIKRIYNTVFPLNDYLQKLLERRYDLETNTNLDDEKEKEIIKKYQNIQKSQIYDDSYTSLYIWGLKNHENEKWFQLKDAPQVDNVPKNEKSDNKHKKKPPFNKFLRKLLLDFMFDLMHSDVFESSKYYTRMRDGLMSDFFFSSIIKKCEFYYYRQLIRNRYNDIKKDENTNFIRKIYAEKLNEAEVAWTDVIMSPLAEKHFSYIPEWYEDKGTWNRQQGFRVSESWFVDPEEEMSRVLFPMTKIDEKSKPTVYLNSYELSKLVGVDKKNNRSLLSKLFGNDQKRKALLARNTRISQWFYRRFDFDDALRLHVFKWWNVVLVSFLLTLCILVNIPCLEFLQCPSNLAISISIAGGCSLTAAIILAIGLRRIRIDESFNTIDYRLVYERRKREIGRAIFIALFLGTIAFFLFFLKSTSKGWAVIKILTPLILLIMVSITPFKRPRFENIHLVLPRLVASITTAWIMIVIGNDMVKEFIAWPLWIILSLVVFVFILYENNKSIRSIKTWRKMWRAFELIVISYSIALVVGALAINILSPGILQDYHPYISESVLPYQWHLLKGDRNLSLDIYPKFLTQFSFLAMFIGVFIQMIFEEKNITEM